MLCIALCLTKDALGITGRTITARRRNQKVQECSDEGSQLSKEQSQATNGTTEKKTFYWSTHA